MINNCGPRVILRKNVVSMVQLQREASFDLFICQTPKENAFQDAVLYTMTSR